MTEHLSPRRLAVGALLLALALVLTWPVVAHPTWWLWSPAAPHSDLAVTHWPNAHFTRRALWDEGHLPLWRPTIMSGTPFAANPLSELYYPLNWPLLFLPWLPPAVGFNLSAVAHLWLAGLTMYGLLRRGFGTGTIGALTAALAYETSPKLIAHLGAGHVGWTQAWAWLPLAVLCWMQAHSAPSSVARRRRTLVTAGVLAIQFLADVRLTAYTLIILLTYRPARWDTLRLLGYLAGLTACQWLPLVAILPETTRTAMTLHDAAAWSLPWRYLTGLLLADYGGFHEWMTYIGLVTLILAGAGLSLLWRRRGTRPWARWLTGLLIGGIWFSLGEHGGLFPLLYHTIPGLGLLRVPPRAWILVIFAGAVLAGWGIETPLLLAPIPLAAGTFPLLLLIGYRLLIGPPPPNLLPFGLLPLPTVILLSRRSRAARLTLTALLLADLLTASRTLITARPPEEVFADGREAAEWLAAQAGDFRVYSPSYSLPQHVAERYGLRLADGVDPLQLRVYADYLTRAAGLTPQGYSVTLPPIPEGDDIHTALRGIVPDENMLGQLGVKYIVAAFPLHAPGLTPAAVTADGYIYRNDAARPLVEREMEIRLSDGTTLFRYNPLPVYLGWAATGATLLGLLFALRNPNGIIRRDRHRPRNCHD